MTFKDQLDNQSIVASLIDSTLLKPEATHTDIGWLCDEALQFGFATVCVNPYWVRLATEKLSDATVRVCTVIGFPLGANETGTKLAEADLALSEGAKELDVVQNVGALRSQDFEFVRGEIENLANRAHSRGAILKVILETSLLTRDEKVTACTLAVEGKADFVKTSTGFSGGGATVQDISLMRLTVGPSVGVKASGGIRTLDSLRQMVSAGANRIGTSAGASIVREMATALGTSNASKEVPSGTY